jgi:hypothetical protein
MGKLRSCGRNEHDPSAAGRRPGDEVVEAAQAAQPDVALLDIEMPGGGGLAAAALLRKALPSCRTVILTRGDCHTSGTLGGNGPQSSLDGHAETGCPEPDGSRPSGRTEGMVVRRDDCTTRTYSARRATGNQGLLGVLSAGKEGAGDAPWITSACRCSVQDWPGARR